MQLLDYDEGVSSDVKFESRRISASQFFRKLMVDGSRFANLCYEEEVS